jgi:hypothetical protein
MKLEPKGVSVLLGQTITKIEKVGSEAVRFYTESGLGLEMNHEQDCCEKVYLEDICGDLEDLIGSPILQAEESTSADTPGDVQVPKYGWDEATLWTFYRFATIKGSVVLRWFGESNGYYSVDVDIYTFDVKAS